MLDAGGVADDGALEGECDVADAVLKGGLFEVFAASWLGRDGEVRRGRLGENGVFVFVVVVGFMDDLMVCLVRVRIGADA